MTAYVSVDGGKSQLRMLLSQGGDSQIGTGPGFSYRPGEDGVAQVLASIRSAAATLPVPNRVTGVVVGLTGVPGERHVRHRLSHGIETILGGPTMVVEDSVMAHAGALAGPGTVLCVGTGTTVLALDEQGGHVRLDGWGPQLGDRGSAYAIGLAGLRAATAAYDGVGPATALVDVLPARLGGTDLASLQAYYRDPDVVARTADVAREVTDAADDGDSVARGICAAAASDLATAAEAAAARLVAGEAGRLVSYSGRTLARGNALHAALAAELEARGLCLVEPHGGPLDGGLSLLRGAGSYGHLLSVGVLDHEERR